MTTRSAKIRNLCFLMVPVKNKRLMVMPMMLLKAQYIQVKLVSENPPQLNHMICSLIDSFHLHSTPYRSAQMVMPMLFTPPNLQVQLASENPPQLTLMTGNQQMNLTQENDQTCWICCLFH